MVILMMCVSATIFLFMVIVEILFALDIFGSTLVVIIII